MPHQKYSLAARILIKAMFGLLLSSVGKLQLWVIFVLIFLKFDTFNLKDAFFILGATPYPELTCFREIENFVVKGGRLKKPINVSSELFSIMTKCWAQRPQKRPNFRQLVEKLNDFKWMDCAYIPLHSINCVYILQPATDEYETRMEELWVSLIIFKSNFVLEILNLIIISNFSAKCQGVCHQTKWECRGRRKAKKKSPSLNML